MFRFFGDFIASSLKCTGSLAEFLHAFSCHNVITTIKRTYSIECSLKCLLLFLCEVASECIQKQHAANVRCLQHF